MTKSDETLLAELAVLAEQIDAADGDAPETSGAGGGSVGMRIGSFEDTLRHVMQDYGVNSVARSSPVPGGRPLAGPPPPPLARDGLQGTRQEVVPPQQ